MRHVYLTLQDTFVLDPLLRGEEDQVRGPFRVLLSDSAVSDLLELGAATGSWLYYGRRDGLLGSRLPFVPGLGALRVKAKSQVEHRAIGHDYGHACFPPNAISSSPTGVRSARRTEELMSHRRLSDTYLSARDRELTDLMAREGATDYYVSEDESTWHFAFSVEPGRRIRAGALTDHAAHLLRGTSINPAAYIHVYPYGGVSVTLGISLVFSRDRDLSEVITLVKALLGRRDTAQFDFEMAGIGPMVASEFIEELGRQVATAIADGLPRFHRVQPSYAVSLGADPSEFSDAELAGLLTLDPLYRVVKPSWLEARASLYGKYAGDRVVASRGSLAVVTSPRHFSPSGRRRFFWRCHAIKELAALQAQTLRRIDWELQPAATAAGPSEATVRRLITIGEHLCEFHRGLPAHHRKWFYECRALLGADAARDGYYTALTQLHGEWQRTAMMRKMESARPIHFEIKNSQIGTLNLGTILGGVETNLTVLENRDAEEVSKGLTELTQAAIDDEDLIEDARRELIESISILSEEAAKEPEERRATIVTSVMNSLALMTSTAAGLATIWTTVEPVLAAFFR
jgi:hypothetical protein